MIKEWLQRRRDKVRAECHRRGFDWAAGLLLRGTASIEAVQAYADDPWQTGDLSSTALNKAS